MRKQRSTLPPLERIAYGIEEAAAMLSMSQRTVYRLVWEGILPAKRSGRRILIMRTDLDAYVGALPTAAASRG
jgi:excisionase family DNA binding protein